MTKLTAAPGWKFTLRKRADFFCCNYMDVIVLVFFFFFSCRGFFLSSCWPCRERETQSESERERETETREREEIMCRCSRTATQRKRNTERGWWWWWRRWRGGRHSPQAKLTQTDNFKVKTVVYLVKGKKNGRGGGGRGGRKKKRAKNLSDTRLSGERFHMQNSQ